MIILEVLVLKSKEIIVKPFGMNTFLTMIGDSPKITLGMHEDLCVCLELMHKCSVEGPGLNMKKMDDCGPD